MDWTQDKITISSREEIEELQERVLLLDQGKAIFAGELSAFRRQFGSRTLEVTFLDASSARMANDQLTREGIEVGQGQTQSSLTLDGATSIADAVQIVENAPGVVGIIERAPSLLDVMERAWLGRR